ncbi:MAG: hypothetical protein M1822_004823 [Bathelium mastoideum]|nr:MAG: hypothetical protein M1822_004823 [Bathelium mastoideum]
MTYQIRSFHLNIDEGDSAFHYRVTADATGSTVDRAILIDGGRRRNAYRLYEFFDSLETKTDFKCVAPRTVRQMDAVVVTHWDGDHVQGLVGAFLADLEKKVEAYASTFSAANPPPSSQALQATIDTGVISDLQCGLTMFDANNFPTTQLWSPYWRVANSKTRPLPQKTPASELRTMPGRANPEYVQLKVQHTWSLNPGNWTWNLWIPIFKLEKSGDELLGLDLFSGDRVLDANNAKSPADVSKELATAKKPPAMFCVACDFQICGGKAEDIKRCEMDWDNPGNNFSNLRLIRPTAGVVQPRRPISSSTASDTVSGDCPFTIATITGTTTSNNQASVACMIVWPNSTEANVTHYFAGDAGAKEKKNWPGGWPGNAATTPANDIEERILRWSTVPEVADGTIRVPINIETIKLSHHGAKFSTPLHMLFAWEPTFIFASNGMRSRYNHVAWENVFLVYAYSYYYLQKHGVDDFYLYCTNYPIYMVNFTDAGGTKNYVGPGSIASLYSTEGRAWRDLWDNMKTYAAIEDRPQLASRPSPAVLYQKKQEICNFVDENWEKFSAVGKNTYRNPNKQGAIGNWMMDSAQQYVRAVVFTHRSGEEVTARKLTGKSIDVTPCNFKLQPSTAEHRSIRGRRRNNFLRGSPMQASARCLQALRLTAKPSMNDNFATDTWGANRLQRASTPQCSEKAFNILTLDNDVYDADETDDNNDGGNAASQLHSLALHGSKSSRTPLADQDFGIRALDDLYYLTATDAIQKSQSVIAHRISVDSNSNANYFLGHLKTASMVFASQPPSSAVFIPMHGSDELYQRLMDICGDYSNQHHDLSAKISMTDNNGTIEGLSFTTQLNRAFDDPTKAPTAGNKLFSTLLTFSTDNNSFAFDNGIWSTPSALDMSLAGAVDIFGPAQVACLSLGDLNTSDDTVQVTGSGLISLLNVQSSPIISLLTDSVTLALNTSKGSKNALWFIPDSTYSTILRLAFAPAKNSGLADSILDLIGQVIGNGQGLKDRISMPEVQIIGKKTWRWQKYDATSALARSSEITALAQITYNLTQGNNVKKLSLQTAIVFSGPITRWILTFNPEDGLSLSDVLNSLCGLFNVTTDQQSFDLNQYLPGLDNVLIRRVTYTSEEQNGTASKSLAIGVQITFAKMIFLCTVTIGFGATESFKLEGSLFPEARPIASQPVLTWPRYMPDYETWLFLEPIIQHRGSLSVANGSAADTGDLSDIYEALTASQSGRVADASSLPPAPIRFELIGLDFTLTSKTIAFSATVGSEKPDPDKYAVPVIRLLAAGLKVDYNFSTKILNELSLGTSVLLTSPKTQEKVLVNLTLDYFQQQSLWQLSGEITGMSGSFLYTLFDPSCDLEMVELLQHVVLSFKVVYSYNSAGLGSEFDIQGLLHIGDFDFDFRYHYYGRQVEARAGTPKWTFTASLSSDAPDKGSLVSVIDSLCGGKLSALLPECVQNIVVAPNGDKILSAMSIVKTDAALVFSMRFQLTDGSSIAFYQIQPTRKDLAKDPVTPTKRVLMFSLDKLPEVPKIPVVGNLDQPFDEMQFYWVSSSDEKVAGLSRADVEEINAYLPQVFSSLAFKDIAKPTTPKAQYRKTVRPAIGAHPRLITYEDDKQSEVVIASGFHFGLMSGDNVVLDYVFGGKKKDPNTLEEGEGSAKSDGPATAPVNKSIGPVTITAISLQFNMAEQILGLKLDGTLKLGPLELSLIGFTIEFDFKGASLKDRKSFLKLPTFDLHGLALSFERNPIILAGMFEYGTTTGGYYYKGAAALGFTPWLFEGGGYYGVSQRSDKPTFIDVGKDKFREEEEWTVIDPYLLDAVLQEASRRHVNVFEDSGTFKSFFAFARLSGLIATIGYAEIRDVCGGFGYNTTIAFPTMQNILDFPFFKNPGSGGVAGALTKFLDSGWVANSEGENWVAAGLTVNAFQMLTVTAIIVVQFGSSVKLGIFGLATAEIPKPVSDKDPPVKFAVVQLGVSATVDFDAGILKIDGQLTPASYILDPSCHLTGGFALYSWFGAQNKSLQGDWVFTIGGYHAAYQPPEQYPRPPRLGISWSYDKSINITGQAYFAITPKACMGGGSLHVTLILGPLYAYFDAWADFLINYKPFQYQASGGISVGVHYTLDLWLVSIPIQVDLGAQLYLQGPPMKGRVHVDFYVFGFDVNFGTSNIMAAAQIGFDEFYKLALQAGEKQSSALLDSALDSDEWEVSEDEEPAAHVFACLNGLIPSGDDNAAAGSKWRVRGAVFVFSVSSKFAINTAKVTTASSGSSADVDNPVGSGNVYAKPMGLTTPFDKSELEITITHNRPAVETEGLRARAIKTDWDRNKAVTSHLPTALWGKYDSASDPTGGNNKAPELLDGTKGGTKELMTGIELSAPTGGPSVDKLAPYNVELAMREIAYTGAFPKIETASDSWSPVAKAASSKEQFENVKLAWKSTGGKIAEAASFWASLPWNTDWDAKEMAAQKTPDIMQSQLDQYYVEAPCLSVH